MEIQLIARLLIFAAIFVPYATASADNAELPPPRELTLLTWPDYLDPEAAAEFERRHKVKLKGVYFETEQTRDEMLVKSNGRGYDLVLLSSRSILGYRNRGWLDRIDPAQAPNLRHIDPRWQKAFPDAAGYGAPYFWGTLGIAYRADLVPEPITRWRQIFSPPEALHGRIMMLRDSRELIGMALKTLGYSINSAEKSELNAARDLLLAQKPYVHSYSYLALDQRSLLVTGEIAAAMMFSGDALTVQALNPNILYTLPEEGGNIWVDYLTVLVSSTNKDLALAFIDFLNEPAIAARQAIFLNYPTPNKAATALLPAEFLHNPFIYPSPAALEKSEFHTQLPPRAVKMRNSIFATVSQ